jgi:inosine-uridine nucleoside N-ribohydrolase
MVVPYVHRFAERHHGMDGLGDVADLQKSQPKIEEENGITAIVRLAHEYKGKFGL